MLLSRESRRFAKRAQPALIPNAITACGLLMGLLVIFKMNMIEPGSSSYAMIYSAALLLLLAALADFADGVVARYLRAQTQFGLIFDSLNDAITFGVAPVVIVLKTLSPEAKTLFSFWATAAAMAFCLCGVLRLVRYSTQKNPQPLARAMHPNDRMRYFNGLPIPAACMALVSLTLLLSSDFAALILANRAMDMEMLRATALIGAQFFLGFLMISRWRFPSLSKLVITRDISYGLALLLAGGMAFFLFLFSHHFSLGLSVVIWSYILGAWGLDLFYWICGSKDRALAPRYDWSSEDEVR